MADTPDAYLEVDIVNVLDHAWRSTHDDANGTEVKMPDEGNGFKSTTRSQNEATQPALGIRATFASIYHSNFHIRMKLTSKGQICGERVIENSRIHSVEGHTIWVRGNTSTSKHGSRSASFDHSQLLLRLLQYAC